MAMTLGGVNPGLNQLNRIGIANQKTAHVLSTGSNRPGASMGASEYAIAARINSNVRATSQSVQNTQNMSSMIKVAAGATSNTIRALTTIKENLINAANDTNGSVDRQTLQKNINQMVQQIDSNAYAEYNGKRMLDGSLNSLTRAGIDGYENIQLGNLRANALGLTDQDGNVTIDASNQQSIQDSLRVVGGALDFVQGIDNDLQASLDGGFSLEEALDQATTQGAQLQRLEYQEANYTTMEENQLAAQSNIDDADMAKQMSNFRDQQTQEQLAMFATRMFNQNRANVISLLQ